MLKSSTSAVLVVRLVACVAGEARFGATSCSLAGSLGLAVVEVVVVVVDVVVVVVVVVVDVLLDTGLVGWLVFAAAV